MFCVECGKEFNSTWKKCPYCGENIIISVLEKTEEKQEEYREEEYEEEGYRDEYVFFENYDGAKRETLNQVFKVIGKLCMGVTILVSLWHIHNEMQAAEDYKWSVYLIRYINAVGMYALVEYIITEIAEWLALKKNQIRNTSSMAMAKGLKIGTLCLAVVGMMSLLNPTDAEQLQIFVAVADDSLADYLLVTKLTWILFIGAAVLNGIFDKKILADTTEK